MFQVCPSGSQEIKLHYSLKRHQILILGIQIKSASLQKKKTPTEIIELKCHKKEEEKEEISTILYRWQCVPTLWCVS